MNAYEFIIKMKDMASSNLQRIAQSVGAAQSQVRGFENSMRSAERSNSSATGNMSRNFGQLIGIVGAVGIAMATIGAMKTLFNMGVEMEQTNIKFEVLLSSTAKATAMLKDLNTYADETPYTNQGIIKGAETMLAFGMAHEKVMPNVKMLGDIAMGNEERLRLLTLAFSQTSSAGRLMGQDLLQMINQGFNPLQIISENTGVSMFTLKKKMEDGAISSDMVAESFRLATSEGGKFYHMSDRMADSAGGKFSTMMGTLQNTVGRVGLKFAEMIKPIFDVGTAVIKNIIPFGKSVLDIIKYVTSLKPLMFFIATAIGAVGLSMAISTFNAMMLTYALGGLSFGFGIASAAAAAFNFVMNMNPISQVILVIAALVAIVWACWNRFESFRGVVMGVWEVMKNFGSSIKTYVINRFSEMLAGVQGIGSALSAFFKGDFTKAFEIGKKAAGDMLGINSGAALLNDAKKAGQTFSTGYAKGVKMVKPEMALKSVGGAKKEPVLLKQAKSKMFDDLGEGKGKGKDKKAKGNADSIVSGGNKMTSITINIEKLQDDTKIFVASTEQGLNSLGDKVQEVILRAVNSINQMQTA